MKKTSILMTNAANYMTRELKLWGRPAATNRDAFLDNATYPSPRGRRGRGIRQVNHAWCRSSDRVPCSPRCTLALLRCISAAADAV